jgi:Cryptococcal mannosyltransferase 1
LGAAHNVGPVSFIVHGSGFHRLNKLRSPWYEQTGLVKYFHDGRSLDEKPIPVPLPFDPEDHERFVSLLPLQVFSCWNGMAAFDPAVFLEHGIRFRGAGSDHGGWGNVKELSDIASECYLISVDMWRKKIGKIVLASRARYENCIHLLAVRLKEKLIIGWHTPWMIMNDTERTLGLEKWEQMRPVLSHREKRLTGCRLHRKK